jgi:hypothetical protein
MVPNGCNGLYAVDERHFHQALSYVALVGVDLSIDLVRKTFFFERLPIVHVRLGYGKVQYSPLSFMMMCSLEPAHGCDALENFVVGDALVVLDNDVGRFYEGDPGRVAQTTGL